MKNISASQLLFPLLFLLCSFSMNGQKSKYKKWENNFNKGLDFYDSNEYKKALPYLETAYQLATTTFTLKDEEYGVTVYELANNYKNLKVYNKAIPMYLKSLNYLELNDQEKELIYGERLYQLGNTYRLDGEYEKAVKVLLQSLEIIENTLGKQKSNYADNLLELSIVYKKMGEFKKAINSNLESNEIIKQLYGKNSKKYAISLSNLSQIYSETGSYEVAIPIQEKVLKTFKEEDKNNISYAVSIYTMAYLYFNINEYHKVIPLYEEVIQILGEDRRGSISAYNDLGQAYDHLGDYEKALFYTKKSIGKTSETDPDLPTRLQNLAFIYVSMGNYDKALKIYEKALISREKISGKDHYLYGKLINNIGKLYEQKGDLNRAEELYEDALDNLLITFDENHISYSYYLNDYASALLKNGNTEKAIDLLKKNISIFKKNGRTNAEDYFKAQFFLAQAYNQIGNYTKALPLLLSASENIQNILGSDHPVYGKILESLSDCYFGLGNIDKGVSTLESSNRVVVDQLGKVFRFRSEKEKKAFLNMMVNNIDHMQSITLNNDSNFDNLIDINLNNQLMLKGLLLNNSKDVLVQLSTLKDTQIDSKVLLYRSLKRDLAKQLSLPIADREKNTDSLKEVINTKESDLVKLYSTKFDDDIHLIKDWKLSQSSLDNDEIALEFAFFQFTNKKKSNSSTMYVAYIYKKDWEHPKMIPLFEEKELKKVLLRNKSPNELYNSNNLYNLVWRPLEKHIENSKKIYFAPSGLLNQISFAAINGDGPIGNKYNLVQLSSTAALSKNLIEPKTTNTLFIGNINYDYSDTVHKTSDTLEYAFLDSEILKNSKANRSRGESWNELPGTLKEINGLQSILELNGFNYSVLTDNEADEASFKNLSGNSPNIIHIATHGFFYENLNEKIRHNMRLSTEDQYRLAEDPLLRSGLILAGANYAWKNGVNPNKEEDGILTAMEISNLDLSNTNMVVLSACETGLGDIDGSEGVYGLQRAFKMAGVDIIVMSLWQVPDFETAEFMNLFYNNWLSGLEVRKAFVKTQRTMQKKYFNEPFRWAAFVLFE